MKLIKRLIIVTTALENLANEIQSQMIYESDTKEQGSTDKWLQDLVDEAKTHVKFSKKTISKALKDQKNKDRPKKDQDPGSKYDLFVGL